MSSRRLRAFKRWMNSNNVNYSDTLDFVFDADGSISVHSLINLQINDLIATIPKSSCLTIKTSKAKEMIEELEFDGALGLSVAMMYERSLKEKSVWDGYFKVLNEREEVPVVWSNEEVELLCGTELHKVVKHDKNCLHDDWKVHIEPLIQPYNLDPSYFGVEQYFSAKSLVSSRSFEIDDYHGYGMVPLADLFNHKTGAEHVHFTGQNLSSSSGDEDYDIDDVSEEKSVIETLSTSSSGSDDDAKNPEHDPDTLEMITVREVEAGAEIFNTYGTMGNAALLHRYGFTEEDNTYDIVNIDLSLVFRWLSSSSFSNRHARSRHSVWKKLNYSSCVSQGSKYFEICFNGEPQIELIILLYIIHLPDNAYIKLNDMADSFAEDDECTNLVKLIDLNRKGKCVDTEKLKAENELKELLMTSEVCNVLVSLADLRESLYGSSSLEDDTNILRCCDRMKERKLYHSLVLRVGERKILSRLRVYANGGFKSNKGKKRKF